MATYVAIVELPDVTPGMPDRKRKQIKITATTVDMAQKMIANHMLRYCPPDEWHYVAGPTRLGR
jgi:hypothetical protein